MSIVSFFTKIFNSAFSLSRRGGTMSFEKIVCFFTKILTQGIIDDVEIQREDKSNKYGPASNHIYQTPD